MVGQLAVLYAAHVAVVKPAPLTHALEVHASGDNLAGIPVDERGVWLSHSRAYFEPCPLREMFPPVVVKLACQGCAYLLFVAFSKDMA